jgi:hypothetical protein
MIAEAGYMIITPHSRKGAMELLRIVNFSCLVSTVTGFYTHSRLRFGNEATWRFNFYPEAFTVAVNFIKFPLTSCVWYVISDVVISVLRGTLYPDIHVYMKDSDPNSLEEAAK